MIVLYTAAYRTSTDVRLTNNEMKSLHRSRRQDEIAANGLSTHVHSDQCLSFAELSRKNSSLYVAHQESSIRLYYIDLSSGCETYEVVLVYVKVCEEPGPHWR